MLAKEADELKILLDLFEQAETKIKNVEKILSEGMLIPSINQLRYAGYHIVRSLLGKDTEELQVERVKAINHVKRNVYDIDSTVTFKERYNNSGFATEIVVDYPEKLTTLDEANKSIQQLCENNNNYDRQQFYQQLSPYLDKLSKIVAIFVQSAPLIAKKQQDKDAQDLKSKRRFIITVIIGIFSIILALK